MKELFQASGVGREGFERILNQYPYARAAAADIRPLVDAGAVALEDYLRDHLRDSTDVFARQRYREMPLYLQHLLFAVSSSYASAADNHDRVINAALSLGEAIFVTLNYDTLLDRELSKWSSGIRSIDSYVEVGSPWSLVKLHGSVNWGRRYNGPADVFREGGEPDPLTATIRSVGDSLEEFLDDEIVLRLRGTLQEIRRDPETGELFYPALSVPLGPGDELNCPVRHVDYLRERLSALSPLNLLVLGYSGLDTAVLKVLKESTHALGSLCVVTNDSAAGETSRSAIGDQFGLVPSARRLFTRMASTTSAGWVDSMRTSRRFGHGPRTSPTSDRRRFCANPRDPGGLRGDVEVRAPPRFRRSRSRKKGARARARAPWRRHCAVHRRTDGIHGVPATSPGGRAYRPAHGATSLVALGDADAPPPASDGQKRQRWLSISAFVASRAGRSNYGPDDPRAAKSGACPRAGRTDRGVE